MSAFLEKKIVENKTEKTEKNFPLQILTRNKIACLLLNFSEEVEGRRNTN